MHDSELAHAEEEFEPEGEELRNEEPSAPSPAVAQPRLKADEGQDTSAKLNAPAEALDKWAQKKKGRALVAVFDLEKDAWRSEWRADEVENPASTQKILTAAAALDLLGPAFTFRTSVLGKIDGEGKSGRLVLQGGGAPDFTTGHLWSVVRSLAQGGLTAVREIVVDQTRFDQHYVPPAFEQQPGEWAAFRAPVSALALDRNTVTLNVVSSPSGGAARTWYDPPGVVVERGEVKTGASTGEDRVIWNLTKQKDTPVLLSQVGGSARNGSSRLRYSRRLDDPRLAPGLAFKQLLLDQRIQVEGEVRLAERDEVTAFRDLPLLARQFSSPLSDVVQSLGKESDNFTAEMLLIALSHVDNVERSRTDTNASFLPWSTERGLLMLDQWLTARGFQAEGIQLKNGSGLFDANRLSPRLLARVLRYMYDRPTSGAEFVGQLALAGHDGTLRGRFRSGALAGRVRAKTGTLRNVSALSGYVLRSDGRPPVAFAILLSGVEGRQQEARERIDQTLTEIVTQLDP